MQIDFPAAFARFDGINAHVRLRIIILGILLLGSARFMHAETALEAGEDLTYSVRWAVLPGAGEIRITAAPELAGGHSRLSITTTTGTRGLARMLLTFEARSRSLFDLPGGRLIELAESSTTRKKHTENSIRFDYGSRRALFTDPSTDRSLSLEIPEGDPADLITTLMMTRRWNLEVGESRDVLVTYRDEFYELTVHAVKLEPVRTPLGEFDTLVLEPRMEKTPPRGMFRRGANVRVWVSRDGGRLPVRFQVDFKFGTGVATLVKYIPPVPVVDARFAAD